jgi:hypothetical protein
MDLKPYVAYLITLLTFIADKTATTVDDSLLSLLKALQDSPQILDWIGALFKKAVIPGGALATVNIDHDDAELAAAFNNSPTLREWAMKQKPESVPGDAEAIGLGSILPFIKFLPTLIGLIKQAHDAGLFIKGK